MTWEYQGTPLETVPVECVAFVYVMTHILTGKRYFGKKKFFTFKTKVIKGKKKKVTTESDWKDYYSSNSEIQKMVEAGEEFKREIIHLCKNPGSANYLEAREQMDHRVLEHPDKFWNGQIQCRIHHSHVKL